MASGKKMKRPRGVWQSTHAWELCDSQWCGKYSDISARPQCDDNLSNYSVQAP
uniref:Uncharacterized protein n=1 Tax=Arundo donax TaxID=35708 RepID=A0A0A9B4P8_ARUDO